MNREFSVCVSEELARWVRWQGSPQEVIEMLAVRAVEGQLRASGSDPGPGPERLTVRFPASGLSRLRTVTHSRENLPAFRKLILAGYQAQALPPAHRMPPGACPKVPGIVLGTTDDTDLALPPTRPVYSPSVVAEFSSAGIYWRNESNKDETLARKRNQERAARLFINLLLIAAGLLFFALLSESGEDAKPSARLARPAGPQDRPWLPETDSHLSKVVWGYE